MYRFENAYVKTASGLLHGKLSEDGIKEFKGIPYALPPVGGLRWKPPIKTDSWRGVREAVMFGGEAVQGEDMDPVHSEIPIRLSSSHRSEDCLYLNVWTPAKSEADKLPVFIYIHGGGYFCGAGSHTLYWGQNLAKHGIIVVTINYRLGVLGFMAHPELSEESPDHVSGNYGILDQNLAIRWVKDNIQAFGGDPERITIGGQSAGAGSVVAQLVSPMSKGLFERATIQSGPAFGHMLWSKTLEDAEKYGIKFQKNCGAKSLAGLRAMSAWDIYDCSVKNFVFWSPIVDGVVIPDYPSRIFAENKANPAALLVGSTGEEFSADSDTAGMEPEEFEAFVKGTFQGLADEVLELYPHATSREAMRSKNSLVADINIYYFNVLHAMTSCQCHDFYLYHFEKEIIDENADVYGSPHSAELPYLFGMKNTGGINPWNPVVWGTKEESFSKKMMTYWSEFVKSGRPACEGEPDWVRFTRENRKIMILDEDIRMIDYQDIAEKIEIAEEVTRRGINLGKI